MGDKDKYRRARERMVEEQLRGRDISDHRVLNTMREIPRHLFISEDLRSQAYLDGPLRLEQGQTISQPYIVALMTQLLELGGEEVVLEIGTGSGYQAAVLSRLARQIYSLERIAELADGARLVLGQLGISNVEVLHRDGSGGLPEHAPYQAIVVTAAAPRVPAPLKEQLADGGRLVLPVGGQDGQMLERWLREGDDYRCQRIAPVAFVPLVGEHGWAYDDRPTWAW
jgi:protein-L-isoaspartate(D-aspartate) O-methyltransferase